MGENKFSAVFNPTTLFSLKDSNSTNSGAKSLFLPSPYAIKMAILNQAIMLNDVDFITGGKENGYFKTVRDIDIGYFLYQGNYCVNNCFIKIQKIGDDKVFSPTISFREYIHINAPIEIIFTIQNEQGKQFLQQYIHKINYFGKRGCFFQFIEYKDNPSEPNVIPFKSGNLVPGLLQQYDDFGKVEFDNVNSFSSTNTKRESKILILPLQQVSSSKSYTHYQV